MGLFDKLRGGSKAAPDPSIPVVPVISSGKIQSLTKPKLRGFIRDGASGQSIFFNSIDCTNFEGLEMGQSVQYKSEIDPRDPLRVHAVEVHSV
jgi:cold shock CspA family protein